MVDNFTKNELLTVYEKGGLNDGEASDEEFEDHLGDSLTKYFQSPDQKIVDHILQLSKSYQNNI